MRRPARQGRALRLGLLITLYKPVDHISRALVRWCFNILVKKLISLKLGFLNCKIKSDSIVIPESLVWGGWAWSVLTPFFLNEIFYLKFVADKIN